MVRGTFLVEYKIGPHRKIEGGARLVMRMVSVDLERSGIGVKVEIEVLFPSRAMLGWWFTARPIEVSFSAPFRIWVIEARLFYYGNSPTSACLLANLSQYASPTTLKLTFVGWS